MSGKDDLGKLGEDLAADFLAQSGLQVVDRNWRCRQGEIDIVATDGQALVVCEVKTRSAVTFGSPLEAVSPVKARRLRRLAASWLLAHESVYDEIRIDVVGVLVAGRNQVSVEHIRGVG